MYVAVVAPVPVELAQPVVRLHSAAIDKLWFLILRSLLLMVLVPPTHSLTSVGCVVTTRSAEMIAVAVFFLFSISIFYPYLESKGSCFECVCIGSIAEYGAGSSGKALGKKFEISETLIRKRLLVRCSRGENVEEKRNRGLDAKTAATPSTTANAFAHTAAKL